MSGPPITGKGIRLVLHDEWGEVWADAQGFGYRGLEYRPRYDVLKSAGVTDWEDHSSYFRTYKAVPAWKSLFLGASEYVAEGAKPIAPGLERLATWAVIGALVYFGFVLAPFVSTLVPKSSPKTIPPSTGGSA